MIMGVFDNIKKQISSQLNQALGKYLDEIEGDAKRIVKKAADSKEAKNRSFNMMDAYGYAIYFNGKQMRHGYASDITMSKGIHKGWAKHSIPADDGRGYLDQFFKEYTPKSKGIELVVVNAIYYASILEAGKGFGGATFRIISQIESDMDTLKQKHGGRVRFFSPA